MSNDPSFGAATVAAGLSQPDDDDARRASTLDFDETFDAHYPDLVRYCHRLTGDRDVAEDLAQESMFRLFGNDPIGSPASVRAWLFTTATHLARDRYRVESNRQRLLAIHHEPPAGADPPDRQLERTEARDLVRAALDSMSQRDREVLLMRYSGFSYKEIADATGLRASSVGTTLARAERRFEEAVGRSGEAA